MEPRKVPFRYKALIAAVVSCLFYFAIRELGQQMRVLAILVFAYGVAKILSRDLVHFPGWLLRLVVRIQDGKLQGKLYVYEQVRMHLFLVEGEAWIGADGVGTLLEPSDTELLLLGKGYALIPGTKVQGFSEAALLRLVAMRQRAGGGRDMKKLENWLRLDALPNLRRFPSSSQ